MAYLVAGPFIALVGILAVLFVFRRKSVEKRSMYSARRQQIEHKVKAARQRTLVAHGHVDKPADEPAAGASPFEQAQAQPTVNYAPAAYQPPPAAPPAQKQWESPARSREPMPWEQPPTPPAAPAPSTFDYPQAPAEPVKPAPAEPFRPAPEPAPRAEPTEPVWTPAPRPSEPATPIRQTAAAPSATAGGSWEIVSTTKDSAATVAPGSKKKDKNAPPSSSWELASGEAPGMEGDEAEVKRPSGTLVAAAQYAILVVGLVMVLIGVLVMVANSHVT